MNTDDVADDVINGLTYGKNVRMSLIQYTLLTGVFIGVLLTDRSDPVVYIMLGVAIFIQAMIWMVLKTSGISMIYCILIGYMTLHRQKEKIGKAPEWIIWCLVFILINIISIYTVYDIIGTYGVMLMLTAHFIGFVIGLLGDVLSSSIS